MKDLPLSKVYQLLEPGPVVLLTTARKGRANIMTMSWHMMSSLNRRWLPVSSAAPITALRLAGDERVRDCRSGSGTGAKVVEVGNCSGRDVEKFARFVLTAAPAEPRGAASVAECFANLECKVADTRLVNNTISSSLKCSRLARPGAKESEDHPPSRIRQVRCGWRDDQLKSRMR